MATIGQEMDALVAAAIRLADRCDPVRGRALPKLVGFFLLFLTIFFLRHPRGFLAPNLWGEDGWVWYPDAYNHGWVSLLWPHTGYLQSFPRLVALLGLPLPLRWIPTLFAAIAFVVMTMPPLLLLSPRLASAWAGFPSRLAFALLYAVLPNVWEVFGNITNSQWFLALLAFLVLHAAPPHRRAGWVFDSAVLIVSGLSGPFCILLALPALLRWWESRDRATLWRLACVVLTVAIQAPLALATMGHNRPHPPLGATPSLFAKILAIQVDLGLLLGDRITSQLMEQGLGAQTAVMVAIAAAGLAVIVFALWRGSALLRSFAIFVGLEIVAALCSPIVSLKDPSWPLLTQPGVGQRYFVYAMLLLAGSFFTLVGAGSGAGFRRMRLPALVLCLATMIGVAGDWHYPKMTPMDFAAAARKFAAAPAGTLVTFPVRPFGRPPMVLVKR